MDEKDKDTKRLGGDRTEEDDNQEGANDKVDRDAGSTKTTLSFGAIAIIIFTAVVTAYVTNLSKDLPDMVIDAIGKVGVDDRIAIEITLQNRAEVSENIQSVTIGLSSIQIISTPDASFHVWTSNTDVDVKEVYRNPIRKLRGTASQADTWDDLSVHKQRPISGSFIINHDTSWQFEFTCILNDSIEALKTKTITVKLPERVVIERGEHKDVTDSALWGSHLGGDSGLDILLVQALREAGIVTVRADVKYSSDKIAIKVVRIEF